MNKKLSILILIICVIGFLGFCVSNTVNAEPKSASDQYKDLNDRIRKLEKQVDDLQAQIKELNSKKFPGVLTVPAPRAFPKNQMPPGATEHQFNGLKYWIVPLKDGK